MTPEEFTKAIWAKYRSKSNKKSKMTPEEFVKVKYVREHLEFPWEVLAGDKMIGRCKFSKPAGRMAEKMIQVLLLYEEQRD